MKFNYKRKIITVTSAIMMMFSVSSIGVNADTWNVHYTPGAPTSDTVNLWVTTFSSTSAINSIKESCTSYSSGTASNGEKSYVKYWGYSTNSSGQNIGLRFSDYYHYGTQSQHTLNFTSSNPAYTVLTVKYQLTTNGVICSLIGNVSK